MILEVGTDRDYSTIAEAVNAVPYREEAVIRITEGVYREKIFIDKRKITLEGAGIGKTVITWGDGAFEDMPDGTKRGTFRSYTVFAGGERVTLKDLTIENTAGPGEHAGQALALYADAERVQAENVELISYQDTLFCAPLPRQERQARGFFGPRAHTPRSLTTQYYRGCRIRGDVDFIFGGADALFEDCRIVIAGRTEGEQISPGGYITAPCECPGKIGLVFVNCTVTAEEPVPAGSVFLGRPWRAEGKTAFLHCTFDDCIHPRRYSGWGEIEKDEPDATLAEYDSRGTDGTPQGMEERNPWVKVLTAEEAARYEAGVQELKNLITES